MKFVLACLLLTLFTGMAAQSGNGRKLHAFLKDLQVDSIPAGRLYKKYMFINKPGEPDRGAPEISYYTDTLFSGLSKDLHKGFNVYGLAKARKKFRQEDLYNYYYNGQKNLIYVIAMTGKEGHLFYYALMYKGKIISLMPEKVLDHAIIKWR